MEGGKGRRRRKRATLRQTLEAGGKVAAAVGEKQKQSRGVTHRRSETHQGLLKAPAAHTAEELMISTDLQLVVRSRLSDFVAL